MSTVYDPGYFLVVGREGDHVLCCTRCGCRKRIEDRPGAMTEAEEAHTCGLPCGCWSVAEHEATCVEPTDG